MDNNQELTYGQKGEICYCGDSVMKNTIIMMLKQRKF